MGGLVQGCIQTHLAEASISLFNDMMFFLHLETNRIQKSFNITGKQGRKKSTNRFTQVRKLF